MRLRLSAHRLLIELGRYYNIPRTYRIYKNCTLYRIEDAEHFLIQCSKFTKEREVLFDLIPSKVKHFTILQDKQILFWILNCEELDILNSFIFLFFTKKMHTLISIFESNICFQFFDKLFRFVCILTYL